ncbi:unnamed protein product, partial [Mesorhabditis belari]|uniref:Uncharacterized protein n=1 Tax=Mesorhabditis belari TaxID=2138241 RepID=A0AAF3ETM6_9BILA
MEIIFASDADILRQYDLDVDMWIQRRPSLFDSDRDFNLLEQVFRTGVDWIGYQSENLVKKEPLPITNRTWIDRIDHRKVVAQLYWCDGDSLHESADNLKTHCDQAFLHISNFIENNRFKKRKCYKYSVLFDFSAGSLPIGIAASILLSSLAKNFTISMWIAVKQIVVRVSNHEEMGMFRQLLQNEKISAELEADGFCLSVAQLAEFDMLSAEHSPIVKRFMRERPRDRSASVLRRVMQGIRSGLISEHHGPPPVTPRKKSSRIRRMSVPELPESKTQPSTALSYKRKPDLERNNSVRQLLNRVGAASPLLSKRLLRRRDKSESPRALPLQNSIESTFDCAIAVVSQDELEPSNCLHRACHREEDDFRKLSVRHHRSSHTARLGD